MLNMGEVACSAWAFFRGIAYHGWRCATGRPRFAHLSDTFATFVCLQMPLLMLCAIKLDAWGLASPLLGLILAMALRLRTNTAFFPVVRYHVSRRCCNQNDGHGRWQLYILADRNGRTNCFPGCYCFHGCLRRLLHDLHFAAAATAQGRLQTHQSHPR